MPKITSLPGVTCETGGQMSGGESQTSSHQGDSLPNAFDLLKTMTKQVEGSATTDVAAWEVTSSMTS